MQPVCDDYFKNLEAPVGPGSLHLNEPVRAYLDAVRQHLLGLHDEGVASRSVNEEHADLVDRLVRKLFRLAEDRYFAHYPRLNFRFAVVAVGGYGRRELSLGSDIDLLFLHKGKLNPYVETITEAITHRLWDAHLVVGVATRTIQDCLRVGRDDLSTLTSYLDARFLIGDPALFVELETAVRDQMRRTAPEFVAAKLEEQRQRHESMGESLFLLQPNLRESMGGLRDYHTALWLARAVHPEVRQPEHLHLHGFIDADELDRLLAALDFVWRVRNELHRSGRKDDRLHYEAQMRLAEKLGFDADDPILRAERMMECYYGHARTIERVSRSATDHARGLALSRRGRRHGAPYSVEEGFVVANGRLEIPSPELIRDRPLRLLSAFRVAQHHDVEISSRSQRILRQHLEAIDDAFRCDPEAGAVFAEILRSPIRVYRTLRDMTELGILGAYLPEFGRLVGLWQQDHYHTYTVDVHSLFLVEQLRRLHKGRFRDELPLATELMREIRDPLVLFLSCLLHDIGKGRGGGHSEKGAKLVPDVCTRIGIAQDQIPAIQFLVRHHLTMSEMAERRDVHDPRQILRLANFAKTREGLRNLYLLTVADIRSVSPEAWTSWKGGLLEAFYRNASEWLEARSGAEDPSQFFLDRAVERVAETEQWVLERLGKLGLETDHVEAFLRTLPRRYLLAHAASEIASHVQSALSFLEGEDEVAVFDFAPPTENDAFWGLVVFGRDQPGLFATVAGVLTACGHDILAAQVYTARSLAVEIFQVRPIRGGLAEHEQECLRIQDALRQVLAGRRSIEQLMVARPAPGPARRVQPNVRVSNDESDFYTVIDVTTNDRPALLHDITRVLAELELNVVTSRARTRASQAADAFYVTDDGHKITDPERQEHVRQALLDALRRGAR